jgi:hypothetical protein
VRQSLTGKDVNVGAEKSVLLTSVAWQRLVENEKFSACRRELKSE